METLKFEGPFHFSHLTDLKLSKEPGLYIWGFVYKKIANELAYPMNFSRGQINIPDYILEKGNPIGCDLDKVDGQFIPYYVGKIEDKGLESRLTDHFKITKGDGRKKTRLTMDEYKQFFFGPERHGFPILIRNKKRIIKDMIHYINSNLNPVAYFNNEIVLDAIYPGIKLPNGFVSNQLPIDTIVYNGNHLNDTLKSMFEDGDGGLNNFWFCYAKLDKDDVGSLAEAITYYSLKGVTISQTLVYNKKWEANLFLKIDPAQTCKNIFKGYFGTDFYGY